MRHMSILLRTSRDAAPRNGNLPLSMGRHLHNITAISDIAGYSANFGSFTLNRLSMGSGHTADIAERLSLPILCIGHHAHAVIL